LVMSRLAEQHHFEEAKSMKQVLNDRQFAIDANAYNYLFTSLFQSAKENVGSQALLLLEEMKKKKVIPDQTTFSTLIVGFIRCFGDFSQHAFQALKDMKEAGFTPPIELCRQVMVQLAEKKRVEDAQSLKVFLQENSLDKDTDIYNVLIKLFTNQNDVGSIKTLLQEMDDGNVTKDSKTWSLLIEAFKNDIELAQGLVARMKESNVQFDRNILSALVGYQVSLNNPLRAEVYLDQMITEDMVPLNFAYTSLLTHYAEKGDVRRAQRIFDLMRSSGITLTTEHYEGLALGYVNKEDFVECDRILYEMQSTMGMRPTLNTYHLVMRRIMYDGDKSVGEAQGLLEKMKAEGIMPTHETYSLLIDGYCVIEDMESAYHVVEIMKTDGIQPSPGTFISMITGYSLKGDLQGAAPFIQRFSSADSHDFIENYERKKLQASKE
jgi:pentatricopeptide repeat protein